MDQVERLVRKLAATKLRDVVKAIRACRTAADERAVVAREAAFIRKAIRDEAKDTRYFSVQKLLYFHMLGYSAHWGQIECIKLAASPKLAEKRLGYLGIMMLLDESQETLTLVTNCLQNDMNSQNVFVAALALTSLANISSPEMARDLCADVEKLLANSNAFLRKKAALCAIRIIKKVPSLAENFVENTKRMLAERTESSLLTGITLAIELCKVSPELVAEFKEQVPVIVRHLKNLSSTGFSSEYEVGGVADPFLQTKMLIFLRILGTNDPRASELMNDVLAQVANATDGSKNVGNSVLYEVVRTIMAIESEHAVKVLAINILAKFLESNDSNARYIALTSLARYSSVPSSLLLASAANSESTTSLHRHRATILACLHDPDTTLRAKAVSLAFHLVTRENAATLIKELLAHLERDTSLPADARSDLARRIVASAARVRVNPAWELFVNLRVLCVAGDDGSGAVVANFVKIVSVAAEDLQTAVARRCFWIMRDAAAAAATTTEGFLVVAAWCCGEFGDLVVDPAVPGARVDGLSRAVGGGVGDDDAACAVAPRDGEVVAALEAVLDGYLCTPLVRAYVLVALAKLAARFADPGVVQLIKSIISKHKRSTDVDVQTRAVELGIILDLDADVKHGVLERMPVLESAQQEEDAKGVGADLVFDEPKTNAQPVKQPVASAVQDLLDLNFDSTPPGDVLPQPQNLAELFGGLSLVPVPAAVPISTAVPAAVAPALFSDLFDPTAPTPQATPTARRQCFDKAGLQIYLVPTTVPGGVDITVVFENTGFAAVSGLSFQVAVPKSLRLAIKPPSSTFIPPSGNATQLMSIENPSGAAVKLRLKVAFSAGNESVQELVEFGGF